MKIKQDCAVTTPYSNQVYEVKIVHFPKQIDPLFTLAPLTPHVNECQLCCLGGVFDGTASTKLTQALVFHYARCLGPSFE